MPAPTSTAASPQSQLALLRRLEWRVRHAVENVLSGEYRSAFRGRGMEFDQVVKYEFGDDVRDIDWNVTARLGEPYRKKFVEEREVTLLLVFEDSPSLQFGSSSLSKREALLELAGLVMLLGAVNRDRVGYVYAAPDGYQVREPVRGRGPILHAASTLLGVPPPPLHETGERKPETGEKEPADRLAEIRYPQSEIPWRLLARSAPKHSILIWLSDFPPREAPEGWGVLQRRYQTMGFRVDDPWERALPAGDTLVAYDPLARRLVTLDGTAAQRAGHADWVKRREAGFRDLFPDSLSRLVVGTREPRLDALVRFFHARMKTRTRG
ncbi:MAG: DUF58 domain-containing protein [Opitutaceae bacterium]|nr:DUF58 domain-containing protein [Opitutaceae bacterium]